MKFTYLLLFILILSKLSFAVQPEDPSNDADAYDNTDGEKKQQKDAKGPIVEDQEIFDEICNVFGTCYRDNPEGYKQCIANCPESECYKCRGMNVKSVCCMKF